MKEQYKSKEKMEYLLKEISEKKLDAEKSVERFCELFDGEYKESRESINQAYYQLNERNFYLTDESGINLSVYSGDMDRFGGSASHSGIDIIIKSPFSVDESASKGIKLFSEGKNSVDSDNIDIEAFYTIEYSMNKLQDRMNLDEAELSVLPDNVRNSEEVAIKRYELLKEKALCEYYDALEYERISPYGGEDVVVVPAYDLLDVYIEDNKDDKFFYNQARKLFFNDKDFETSINEEYKDLKNTLFIIDNIEEYKQLAMLDDIHFESEKECEHLYEQRAMLAKEIAELNTEKKGLEGRSYGIISRLRGDMKKDKLRIEDITNKINASKSEFDDLSKKYKDAKMHNEISANAAEELRSRLKVPCYEINPESLLKHKDYCLARVKQIDLYRKEKNSSRELTLDEKIKRASSEPEYTKQSLKELEMER